ncbi:alpha/beta hydrolase [Oscillochloris sp. ZM17-4]|uniref:alpha/beta fold hydrolase n=1 Tax=Oscillochloris sp. ZM17-4 TaxID=2866714 RepID=UPI001C73ACF1|nr:alpha/beta hydrolase [Oscillochloris sp. ZM17-4]MBX0330785.1 alpha/beta hydrolase [Oscillochloris sp. ZM17-4]
MTTHTIHEHWLEGLHGPMRYWHSAPHHGLPVILIHGYGAMIEHWSAVMRSVARQHCVVAPDLYYFGKSAIPHVPPSRRLWSDQIAELIADVCHGPAIIVGHSMGGMVAAQVAHDYPQLVRGLVLVDSTGLTDPQNQPSELENFFYRFMSSPGVGELLASVVANELGARQGLLSSYYRKDRVTRELIEQFSAPLRRWGGREAYLTVSRAFPELSLDFEKGEVTVPTLLIWGEHDQSVPPTLAGYFQRTLLPQATIAIIPNSGHCPFDETPQEFCDILLPWLDTLGAED